MVLPVSNNIDQTRGYIQTVQEKGNISHINPAAADADSSQEEEAINQLQATIKKLKSQSEDLASNQEPLQLQKESLDGIAEIAIQSLDNQEQQQLIEDFRKFADQVRREAEIKISQNPEQAEVILAEAEAMLAQQKIEIQQKLASGNLGNEEEENPGVGQPEKKNPHQRKDNPDSRLDLPMAILSLLILQQTMDIMAQQTELSLQKIKELQQILEQIQAFNSFIAALQNKLNNAYGHQKDKDDKSDPNNNMSWANVQQNYGEPVDHDVYNFVFFNGSGIVNEDFYKKLMSDPIFKFLVDNKLIDIKTGTDDKGKTIYMIPPNVKIDLSELPDGLRAQLETLISQREEQKKNKDKTDDYQVLYSHKEYTSDPTYYDKDGNQVMGPTGPDGKNPVSNPKYQGTVVFSKSDIPPALLPYIEKFGLSSSKGGPIDHYAINDDAITKLCDLVTTKYNNILGARDDFTAEGLKNDLLTGSVSTIQVRMDTVNNLLKYVQETLSAEAKKPDQAKTDADYKLQQFLDTLPRTQYSVGN